MKVGWRKLAKQGRMMEILDTLPADKWPTTRYEYASLLHLSCCGNNVEAAIALINAGISVDSVDSMVKRTPLHLAVCYRRPQMVELLLVYNADARKLDHYGWSVINENVTMSCISGLNSKFYQAELQLILANGWRLTPRERFYIRNDHYELFAFEQGVIRCRDVIVTLLGLKKRHKYCQSDQVVTTILPQLDRFLVQQVLAVEIWTTRSQKKWSQHLDNSQEGQSNNYSRNGK